MDWVLIPIPLFLIVVGVVLVLFSGKIAGLVDRTNGWVYRKLGFESAPFWSGSALMRIYSAFGLGCIIGGVLAFVFLLVFGS